MSRKPGGNLGAAGLPRRRRGQDPMRAYDALPPELRRWIAGAALPWSPASCGRLWRAARARGDGVAAALARLDRAERATLARRRAQDRSATRPIQSDPA